MDEFLSKLYNYEYFGTYLMISIAVLVLLFIIILVFGKKDQKNREIEATKKLQQLNANDLGTINTFGETSMPNKVETEVPPLVSNPLDSPMPNVPASPALEPNLENDTIIVPTIDISNPVGDPQESPIVNPVLPETPQVLDSMPKVEPVVPPIPEEPVMPINNPVNNVEVPNNEFVNPFGDPTLSEPVKPVLEKIDEQPFNFSSVDLEPVTSVEPIQPEVPTFNETPQVEVPTFNFADIVDPTNTPVEPVSQPKEVFSSVYTPEEKVEEPKIEMPAPKNDDDIELPTLKKDVEEIEKPVLNDYNLNDLSGETYNINN